MATTLAVRLCTSCRNGVGTSPTRLVCTWHGRGLALAPWTLHLHHPASSRPLKAPRWLSISAVWCGANSSADGEMFKTTETITDATGTGNISGNNISAEVVSQATSQPAVDFASLGLGGYWPSGWIQSTMELLHNHTHLPWWGCIVLLTAVLRLAIIPIAVKMQVIGAKVANANKDAQAIQQRIMQCRASGDKVGESQAGVDMMKLYQRTANPFLMIPLGFCQLPIFLSMFRGLQGMALLPVESLRTGGALWCTDLVAPDPMYLLSLIACGSFLTNIQLGGEGGATTDNEMSRRVRMVLRVCAVAIIPFTVTFPAAILTYWVANSVFSAMQILLFKLHPVKKLFGIPLIVRRT